MPVPRLHIQDPHGHVTALDMGDAPITIGRDERNTLRLADQQASRQHCVLLRVGPAVYAIDLNSHNGTRLNGVPIHMAPLRPDDVLEIGNTRITLAATRDNAPPKPKPMPPPYPRPVSSPDPARKTGPLDPDDSDASTSIDPPGSSGISR